MKIYIHIICIMNQLHSTLPLSSTSTQACLSQLETEQKVAEWAGVLATVALHGGVVGGGLGHVQGVGRISAWT